jgi:hypothetical protein
MLVAAKLVQAARDETGLGNFGDDYFREGLERFVASVNSELVLNDTGFAAVHARTQSYLVNRLLIEECYRRNPEIDDEQIVAPLFGLGLPRTGSTVLQCLLAEDPAVRSLRTWESEQPCPPPEAATQYTDPRIARAQAGIEELHRLAPMLKKMLPLETANDPTECQDLVGLSHRSQAFLGAVLPGFIDWLMDCDMEPAYRYHKRALKVLQWHCPPKRWRLKSPVHMLNLEALRKVYPDARLVATHRDVSKSLPSMAAMLHSIGNIFLDECDPNLCGRIVTRVWETGLRRMIAFRERHGDDGFYDIGFHETQADPIESVQKLYAWLGEACTPQYLARMQEWLQAHPKGKHGEYQVVPEAYGLSAQGLKERYAFYMDRYRPLISPASSIQDGRSLDSEPHARPH